MKINPTHKDQLKKATHVFTTHSSQIQGFIIRGLQFLVIIILAWLVSKHLVQLMLIQGESMEPSYHNLQLVLLDKYDRTYEQGDVVAFHCQGLGCDLVKRVVAVPGDTVEISKGRLLVNGETLSLYRNGTDLYEDVDPITLATSPITLGSDEYFLLSDNHSLGHDSRYTEIGTIHYEDMIGKVVELQK